MLPNLMTLLYGISIGWASSNLLLFQTNETPLSFGPLTLLQTSWIGSILCLGGAIGQLFFSWLADEYGRKPGLAFAFVPVVLGWILIEFGQEFYSLLISRFLSGFAGGAVYQIIPLFVSEVSNVNIRGLLGSFLMLFTNLGTLTGFIICSFVPYRTVPWIAISISLVFLLGFCVVPETPKYLLMKKKEQQFLKSIEFYSGRIASQDEVKKNNEYQCTKNEPTSMKLKTLCNVSSRNGFKLGFTLMSCCCFSGVFTVLNYTDKIFIEAGSNLTPAISSIIVASIQLAGSYLATVIVEKTGRRILIICSTYGSAGCLTVMGAHSFLKDIGVDVSAFNWIPLLCLSLLVFIAANGATTVSFIIIGEIFTQKIRGLAISLCLLYQWTLAFLLVLIFPYLIEYLKMYGALWIFSIAGIIIATIMLFILPETKGKKIDEIVQILGGSPDSRSNSCTGSIRSKKNEFYPS
uniref:CSON013480 protein n=1 Tax=Culicoides sonorensis TaxID=179676 RepID=A0A336M068_CULSO